jgi:hypothetical protein
MATTRHTFAADKNTSQGSKTTAVAAKVYMATKQQLKLPNFWRGELRHATKHALTFPSM